MNTWTKNLIIVSASTLAILLAGCAAVAASTTATSPPAATQAAQAAASATPDPADEPEPGLPAAAVLEAQRWLAERLGVPVEQVVIAEARQAEWPDACLGLAESGEVCAEVITPGWRVLFEVNGQAYAVRTDATGSTVRLASGEQSGGLAGTGWRLEQLTAPEGDVPLVPTTTVTLAFQPGGQLVGFAGCNEFGGEYTVANGGLTVTNVVQTERACLDQRLMDIEQQYLAALSAANTFSLEGERLTLAAANGASLQFAAQNQGEEPGQSGTARVPGILEFHGEPTDDVITLPDRLVAGQAIQITISTFGGGCEEAGDTAVILTTDGASLFVYDQTSAVEPGVVCTAILKRLSHTVTLTFAEPGEKRLRFWGRRVAPDAAGPLGEPLVVERTIVVE